MGRYPFVSQEVCGVTHLLRARDACAQPVPSPRLNAVRILASGNKTILLPCKNRLHLLQNRVLFTLEGAVFFAAATN